MGRRFYVSEHGCCRGPTTSPHITEIHIKDLTITFNLSFYLSSLSSPSTPCLPDFILTFRYKNMIKTKSTKPTKNKKQTRKTAHKTTPHTSQHRKNATAARPKKVFRPYGGLAELTSGKAVLHIPIDDTVKLTKPEILKLSQLSYLNPPRDDAEYDKISNDVGQMVNWLSTITHVNVDDLPHTRLYRQHQQLQRQNTPLYTKDPAQIPFYTPLSLLKTQVPPEALTIAEYNGKTAADESSLLRLRPDVVQKTKLQDVIDNATHSQYGFYVVPNSKDGDE